MVEVAIRVVNVMYNYKKGFCVVADSYAEK